MARCDTSVSEEARATIDSAAERQVGGCGIGGILLAGGVLNDAMLPSQTAGMASDFLSVELIAPSQRLCFDSLSIVC